MRNLNILFVVPGLSRFWGGITTSVLSYYKGIIAIGHSVTVAAVYLEKEPEGVEENLLTNPDFHFFPASFAAWRYSPGLAEWLDAHIGEYDLVHIHGMWTAVSFLAVKASLKGGVPYVISPHGMLEPDALQRKRIKKKVYLNLVERRNFNGAAFIHCVSENEMMLVNRMFRARQVSCVPNGIAIPEPLYKDHAKLNSVAFIGRLHPKKGLDRLIEAIAQLPQLRLLVAGTGEKSYEAYIFGIIRKYGVENRVSVLGFADDSLKRYIFANSLLTVIPSFSEGLSMTGLESLGYGTPVLVTKQCNLDEVGPRLAGIVISNNEVESIREGIEKTLSLDIPEMSQRARDLALEKFDITRVSVALLDRYQDVISARHRERA